jgi:hypothetical protein
MDSGSSIATVLDEIWQVEESPEALLHDANIRALVRAYVEEIVRRYRISHPSEFTCPHIRSLARALGFFEPLEWASDSASVPPSSN